MMKAITQYTKDIPITTILKIISKGGIDIQLVSIILPSFYLVHPLGFEVKYQGETLMIMVENKKATIPFWKLVALV